MAKDFSIVPAVITITNTDPGVIDKDSTTVVDGKIEVAYATEPSEQKVQLYRVNFWVSIAPEESVKLVAQTTEEIAYYSAMASDKLAITVEKAV